MTAESALQAVEAEHGGTSSQDMVEPASPHELMTMTMPSVTASVSEEM